jgi:hypothetical protein
MYDAKAYIKLQTKIHQGLAPLRLRMFASFLRDHRKDVWDDMGCDYDRDVEPVNAQAHEASLETDVDVFKGGYMEAFHVKAFEIVYGVTAEQADGLLGKCPVHRNVFNTSLLHRYYTSCQTADGESITDYPNIRECYDLLGTLRWHGKEYDAVQAFFTEVERASPEDLEALDKGAHVGGKDACSRTLGFLREKVKELKEERQKRWTRKRK